MDYDTHFRSLAAEPAGGSGDSDEVDIIATDVRLHGKVVMGQFRRMSDLFNQGLGYVVIRNAQLLKPNGDGTAVEIQELMLRREDITFCGQADAPAPPPAEGAGPMASFDRPLLSKVARRVVFYVSGVSVTTNVHTLEEMKLSAFLDTPEPRFIPTTDARVRSLDDGALIGEFALLLLNRERITAAADASLAGLAAD